MAKSAINDLRDELKLDLDYDITDPVLDTLILNNINKGIRRVEQLLLDHGILDDITTSSSFKTIEDQEYVDIRVARIVGDTASFTAVAGDKITVTIDGVDYTTAALTGAVLVATVVTAINLATAAIGDVASETDDGYLAITSLSTGSTSAAVISDNAGTGAERLYTVEAERSQDGISDLSEIIKITDRVNDRAMRIVPFSRIRDLQPDPTSDYDDTPTYAARSNNRIYFVNTPSTNRILYLDYYKQLVKLVAGDTMPFIQKYDPLIQELARFNIIRFLDDKNTVAIATSRAEIKDLKKELITAAARNIGMVQQSASRREEDTIAPRIPETSAAVS